MLIRVERGRRTAVQVHGEPSLPPAAIVNWCWPLLAVCGITDFTELALTGATRHLSTAERYRPNPLVPGTWNVAPLLSTEAEKGWFTRLATARFRFGAGCTTTLR